MMLEIMRIALLHREFLKPLTKQDKVTIKKDREKLGHAHWTVRETQRKVLAQARVECEEVS